MRKKGLAMANSYEIERGVIYLFFSHNLRLQTARVTDYVTIHSVYTENTIRRKWRTRRRRISPRNFKLSFDWLSIWARGRDWNGVDP